MKTIEQEIMELLKCVTQQCFACAELGEAVMCEKENLFEKCQFNKDATAKLMALHKALENEIIEYLKEKENKGHCPTDCKCDLCEAERRIAKLETKQEKPEVLARSAGVFCGRTYSIEEETREGITYITKLRISGEEWVKKGYPPAGPTEQAKGLKALALSDFISMSNSLAQALYDAGYRKSTP